MIISLAEMRASDPGQPASSSLSTSNSLLANGFFGSSPAGTKAVVFTELDAGRRMALAISSNPLV